MTLFHAAGYSSERDDLIGRSFPTFALGGALHQDEVEQIEQWMDTWLHTAVGLGFVEWPYVVGEAMISNIRTCYRMKLEPEEAVYLCFRLRNESELF